MRFYNCDVYSFKEYVKNKKLICFGAGQGLKNFINHYSYMNFEEDIDYVADNMNRKIGSELQIGKTRISVISVSQLIMLKDIVILISCADIWGVYEQLSSYHELEHVPCFATIFIRGETNQIEEKKRVYPQNYRITSEQQIPKKIHYCWFGKKEIPEKNKKWMESWEKYCPDYEIIRWDENNYDITKNEYMYEAYKAERWGFVSDYARLDIIFNHGGIYLDTDVELIKNLDDLLYQFAFSGVDGSRNISLGLGFGAQIKESIIKELRDLYLDIKFKNEDGSYNIAPIPTLQKEFFNNKGYINNGEFQIVDRMTVYPEKVLSAKCNYTRQILPTEHSFAIHHYDGSWVSDKRNNMCINNIKLFERSVESI